MKKIPISGGPGTGKTTLINQIQTVLPNAYIVPEPAEIVITAELALAEKETDYIPAVPWIDYSRFGPKVAAKSEQLESEIPAGTELVLQDRSLIDTIAYCRIEGFETFIPTVLKKIAKANYAFAFFCEPVGVYTSTEVRHEDREKAQQTHQQLKKAYSESGLEVVELPSVSVEKRLQLLKKVILSQ